MKSISKSQWDRYKQTDGKDVIEWFERMLNLDITPEELLVRLKQINPSLFKNITSKEEQYIIDIIDIVEFCNHKIEDAIEATEDEELGQLYGELIRRVATMRSVEDIPLDEIPEGDFKGVLGIIMPMSVSLSFSFNTFFIPYFWTMQFFYLEKIAQKYEISLPDIPARSKYFERCAYYLDYCDTFEAFARENELTRAELCAFLYDYELDLIREELEYGSKEDILPDALQAWILVGSMSEGEKVMESGFWQANVETRKGDIFVFYEKAPVKSINAIWRASTDGTKDPIFVHYSSANICNRINIPAISLDELRSDDYFKNHPLVRKNFQGGSGWPLNSEDYTNLKRMLSDKGYDVSNLPSLRAHETPKNLVIENENDVHVQLVLPLLKEMGWTKENGDIAEQVNHHVGRGETQKLGRTDISLHPYGEDGKNATVVIEEKFWMKDEKEIEAAYEQGESYAKLSNSRVLVTCDKQQIRVYPREKNGHYAKSGVVVFYWDEVSNPDKFKELYDWLK